MRYLLMVSHGTLAPGLHSVLKMLSGSCDGVLSCSMEDGMGADDFVCRLEGTIAPITSADEVLVLGDIIGGSPLTNTLDTLARHGLLAKAVAFGGMNLPMALTALMGLQTGRTRRPAGGDALGGPGCHPGGRPRRHRGRRG
ncbi:MAG: PTS fructose transporter subunit IIA [Atopobiaceae bacterium]|jgi:PTS system N-acetylgalactosamine-specific IIA component|nr:PTS fructose transporter subunit IIA [Atopobiaceae bacterium]